MKLARSAESLVQRYERSATIRALVQPVPFSLGSALDTAVLTRMQSIRADRTREFFDELEKGAAELRPELLESNDFLHCFSVTTDAALRTHRAEKFRAFARLLRASTTQGRISGVAEYEELFSILEDLSDRELAMLSLLDRYEAKYPKIEGENELQRANRYWAEFSNRLVAELGIHHDEIDALLTRLNRSGCYETITGAYISYTGGKGKTTPTYQKLKALALEKRNFN
jgi:hypothetical protein